MTKPKLLAGLISFCVLVVIGYYLGTTMISNTSQTNETLSPGYTQLVTTYSTPEYIELDFVELQTLVAPEVRYQRGIDPITREDDCVVIKDAKEYENTKQSFGTELCTACADLDYTEYSIVGMLADEVINDPDQPEGFSKLVYKNDTTKTISYIVISDRFKVEAPMSTFFSTVHASYLAEDQNWLTQIPRIPDDYTLECIRKTM